MTTPDIDALVARLRAAYTAWNNPPSDGLPEAAGIVLEAASALTALQADLKAARAENKALSDETDALEDEGCGVDDDIRKMTDRAEKAEDALTVVCIERDRLRENVKQQVHCKGVAGSYRDEFKSRAEAAEASLAKAREAMSAAQDRLRPLSTGGGWSLPGTYELARNVIAEIERALTTHRGSE